MRFAKIVSLLFSGCAITLAQGTWTWSGRTHPELEWSTLRTEHFNVHYHNGIEQIALRGATIAEQIWPTLLKQVGLESIPTVDVVFTAEDEIMNGYALWTNQTFIWVDQNDAIVWLEDEKWLYQVLAHELEHVALMNAVKSWMPEPFGILLSGTPGWFVEGSAEYFTERWRPYRSDLTHKFHVFKKRVEQIPDPHAQGYSKMLYWADRFGDSTIVKVVRYRNKLKLFNFKKAFKKATGVELKQFQEDWRSLMNTYYYGYRAQKETFGELGKTATLPVKDADWFAFSPDSLKIAIIGRDDKGQHDLSVFIAKLDTTAPKQSVLESILPFKKDTTEKKLKKPRYDVQEIDYGQIGRGICWSPDGNRLAYAKYRYGDHGSLIWGIRIVNAGTGEGSWLTPKSMRAAHPNWSPDGQRIVFVAHLNGTSNLYVIHPDGTDQVRLTNYADDIQILTPRWSPDGKRIAFAMSGPEANCDIYVMEVDTRQVRRMTTDPAVDYLPVWHPDGEKITYTSHRGSTPNLHTVVIGTGESIQNTDVGEALWGVQWTPKGETVTAATLADVDTVRIVQVDPSRSATTIPLSVRKPFAQWRKKGPRIKLSRPVSDNDVPVVKEGPYKFYKHPKHFTSLALPYPDFSGLFGFTVWSDAMGKHLFQAGGGTNWDGSESGYIIGYMNAEHGPLWGINYFYNSRWSIRPYDESKSWLIERFDGWNFFMTHPVNFGNSLTSNHLLYASVYFQNRQPEPLYDSVGAHGHTEREAYVSKGLPTPESGKEGILSLAYQWLSRRPHQSNIYLPHQGAGVRIVTDLAHRNVYGSFTYGRLTLDSFVNLPVGPVTLFLRGKTVGLAGTPPAQDYVGLSNDFPIYLPGFAAQALQQPIIAFAENHNPRGWKGVRLGDRLVFSTTELRLPVVPKFPVINVLGFTFGSITAALISDIANAWYVNEKKESWIITGGYEAKLSITIGEATVAIVAVGQAQTVDDWKAGEDPHGEYVRLALINPF